MKNIPFNQTIVTALAVFIVSITLNVAQAEAPKKFSRVRGGERDEIRLTGRAVQENHAPAPSKSQAPPQVQYMVIDLGTDGIGNGITDSGQIVGSKNFAGPQRHAAFWPKIGSMPIDLDTLPDGFGSRGFGVNPAGQIVGYDFPPDFSFVRPLFWANSQSAPIELPGLPLGAEGIASDINPAGQIVGLIADDSGGRPVFWSNSNTPAVYLSLVSNEFPNGQAYSINGSGNILGVVCNADFSECHVAFWTDSTSAPVALASPGGEFISTDEGFSSDFNVAHALNNAGSMVGFTINSDGSETRAVFWASSSTPAMILSTTDEFSNGTAESINDKRQIVGTAYSSDFSAFHAFFWPSPTSPGIDLNTVIPAGSGLELAVARAINNRGEITGAAYPNGQPPAHVVLLIPVHGR